jgi:hypothetical protein
MVLSHLVFVVVLLFRGVLVAPANFGTNKVGCKEDYDDACHDSATLLPVFIKFHKIGVGLLRKQIRKKSSDSSCSLRVRTITRELQWLLHFNV